MTSGAPPSNFIHQFELVPSLADARVLRIRLDMARQFYNAMLGEARRRYARCRQDPRWQEARACAKSDAKRAKGLYDACRKAHGYTEFGLVALIKDWRHNTFQVHLDQKACQDLTVRAFRAHEAFLKDRTHTAGKRRRLRFKRPGELDTVSSVGIKIDTAQRTITWWGLTIPYRLSDTDLHGLEAYALDLMQEPGNICDYGKRITRKVIRGDARYYVQLTLKGAPFQKAKHHYAAHAKVGLDLGPSTLAIASEHGAALVELAPECARDEATVRRLQRYLDRSRRATNPECFDAEGRCTLRPTHKSQRYRAAERALAEVERRLAVKRRIAHNALVHSILEEGTEIYTEKLSLKGWQRGLFGKSLAKRAPAMLLARLKQQAEQVGGHYYELPTAALKLSQLCHGCGTYRKKPLSERIHQCACGVGPIQRDIYSALLARFYIPEDTTVHVGAVRTAFARLQSGAIGMDSAFKLRGCRLMLVAPRGSGPGRSGSIAEGALEYGEAGGDQRLQKAVCLSPPSGNKEQGLKDGSIRTFQEKNAR